MGEFSHIWVDQCEAARETVVLRQNQRELLSVIYRDWESIVRMIAMVGRRERSDRTHVSIRSSEASDRHGAVNEVTSRGASFITMVQAADFSEC